MHTTTVMDFLYLKSIGADVQPRAGTVASVSVECVFFRWILITLCVTDSEEAVDLGTCCTVLGLSDDVLAAGIISISTVLLWAGDTRISGWVQSISTAADCEETDETGL